MKTKCLVIILLISTYGRACPTCVGRVTKQSAPFFSDECYHTEKKHSKTSSSNEPKKTTDSKTLSVPLKNKGK